MTAHRRVRISRSRGDWVGAEGEVPIQRDGPLTLSTPSLLDQKDRAARYNLGVDTHLELDPAILAMMRQFVEQQIDPARLRPSLQKVNLNVPASGAAGAAPNPLAGPATPAPAPLVPRGAGPSTAHAAETSDLAEAILAVPAIDQGISNLRSQASDRVGHDWRQLRTGEKVGVISTIAVIGGGTIAGIASDPDARRTALGLLNGRPIPVPEVDWLHLELNTAGNNVMVGMHVDVGALLPKSWGFGPGDPNPIGGPPGQRSERAGANPDSVPAGGGGPGQLAARVRGMAGQGSPLGGPMRERLEEGLGANLSTVRVHTGGEADELARALDADAFTTGRDIFFRAGTFDARSKQGARLIAHEVTHTLQQAAGPVAGTPIPGGLVLSHPSDPDELAARRIAELVVEALPGHHFGSVRIYPSR